MLQLGLMGMEFEKLKKIIFRPTGRPILEKQGWVRGNKNIFKVGLKDKLLYQIGQVCMEEKLNVSIILNQSWYLDENMIISSIKDLI